MRHLYDVLPALSPREGYDRAASIYDNWHWAKFWRENELPVVAEWLDGLAPGLALDAGSGTGTYRFQFQARGHRCVAVDLSLEMLKVQEMRCAGKMDQWGLFQGDIQSLPFTPSKFDYLLCARVLSHIERLDSVVAEFARVVRPEGRLILTDVHPDHPYDHVTVSNSFKVRIRIHKHAIESLSDILARCGAFRMVSFEEYRLRDLAWKPPKERFEKIYENPDLPIFYICSLQRV